MEKDLYYDANDLNSLLLCKICDQKFQDPRILPCGESYCNNCINSEVNIEAETAHSKVLYGAQTKTIKCQNCRKKHELPREGFLANLTLNKIVLLKPSDVLISRLKKTEEEKEAFKKGKQTAENLLIQVLDQENFLEPYRNHREATNENANPSDNSCLIS